MAVKILLVDQFSPTPTPFELSLRPMKFDELVSQELARPTAPFTATPTQVLEVPDDYQIPYASIAFRAGANGIVEVWRSRLDSSG